MICKNCYYFSPFVSIGQDGCIVACCKNPECFEPVMYQNEYGEVKERKKRIKDIIDLVNDEQTECSCFSPFVIKKKRKKIFGFIPYTKKIKVAVNA